MSDKLHPKGEEASCQSMGRIQRPQAGPCPWGSVTTVYCFKYICVLDQIHLVTETQADRHLLLLDLPSACPRQSLGNSAPGEYSASAPVAAAASQDSSSVTLAASSLVLHDLLLTF